MESYIGAAPSSLIGQLDFSLQSTAPYVLRRRSVRMYPSSASTFASNAVNVCRLTLAASDEWLDPSTLRFVCTVNNSHEHIFLQPYSVAPSSLFSRVREMCGGTVISDIMNYARTCEAFQSKLEPSDFQWSEGVLGFAGTQFGDWCNPTVILNPATLLAEAKQTPQARRHPRPGMIGPNSQYTCVQRLLTGMVKSNKLVPLRVCPLTYELTMEVPALFADPTYSQAYTLTNCYILCDLITLDSSIQNSYMQKLLSGAALAMTIPSYITVAYPVTNAQQLAIVVQRALTRNVAVFVNFNRGGGNVTTFVYPDAATTRDMGHAVMQEQHGGHAQIAPTTPLLMDNNFSFQLQLGSKLWPEQPMSSLAECYETLRKAAGTHNQDIKSISIDRCDYVNDSFILGVDLEKNLGDPFSAENTRAGDVLRLVFNNIDLEVGINMCYVHLIGSSIVEIRETGAYVFD